MRRGPVRESSRTPAAVGLLLLLLAACASGSRRSPRAEAPGARPPRVEAAPRAAAWPDSIGSVESLYSTLWMQTSAERRAISLQTYALAADRLVEALADSGWTAYIEQTGDFRALPPAIVLDIDETVLDNSPSQARQILSGRSFDPAEWGAWVEEARARPLPGVARFLRRARDLGVEVFYVSNRDSVLEAATRRNLEAFDLPLDPARDVVLMRGERPGWTGEKAPRRSLIARDYRILLLIGDDLNDFVPARTTWAERDSLVEQYADYWGRRWIVLPNPIYGSWERALTAGEDDLPRATRVLRRLETQPAD